MWPQSSFKLFNTFQRPKCQRKCKCCDCHHEAPKKVCGKDNKEYRNACDANCNGVVSYAQCPRVDLNKKLQPEVKTTTA